MDIWTFWYIDYRGGALSLLHGPIVPDSYRNNHSKFEFNNDSSDWLTLIAEKKSTKGETRKFMHII